MNKVLLLLKKTKIHFFPCKKGATKLYRIYFFIKLNNNFENV